jgi:uncharacterized membrane protein YhaH (DUF805 family)
MTFFQAIRSGFRKYADFTGTASRSEFWWWVLFATLASTILTAAANVVFGGADTGVNGLWSLVVLLPSLAVTVRRLRDAGYGWGHAFWLLLPFAGALIIAVLCAQPADHKLTAHRSGTDVPLGARS